METTFTLLDLLRKAAKYKGLKLHEGASKAYSEPIKTYELDDRLLAVLAEQGIKRQDRPDCNYEIVTLVDENPQEKVPGWAPSNYWSFKRKGNQAKFNLHVELSVGFGLNLEKRGFVLVPKTHASMLSPCDALPNLRMFQALVQSDPAASAVAKELAAGAGSVVVTWTDLGLGGIRRLSELFGEFAGTNQLIQDLARDQKVFNPMPYPRHQQPGDEWFITEPAQPGVIQAWRTQLNNYRSQLAR